MPDSILYLFFNLYFFQETSIPLPNYTSHITIWASLIITPS